MKFVSATFYGYEEKRKLFFESNDYYDILVNPEVMPPFASVLAKEEKEKFIENQQKIASAVVNGKGYLLQAPCVFISFDMEVEWITCGLGLARNALSTV